MDTYAESTSSAQRVQLAPTTSHHRQVVSRGGHPAIIRPPGGRSYREEATRPSYDLPAAGRIARRPPAIIRPPGGCAPAEAGWATSCEYLLTAWCAAWCWQWADERGRPTNRAACSWTQHCRWTNLPYQPGSLPMDTTLPLDQPALPTGQPAHGHNTAAGPTCPTNRAACSWTQHCRWTNLPYQPGSLLMDTTLPLDQPALPTGQPAHGHNTAAGPTCPTNRAACSWTQHCRWTNLPYQPGSLLMDTTLPLDQPALPTGQPAHGHNTAAGPTCPTNRAACSWTQHCRWTNLPYQPGSLLMDTTLPLDQPALLAADRVRWSLRPPTTGKPLGGAFLFTTSYANMNALERVHVLAITC